jgi:hypothetical protein
VAVASVGEGETSVPIVIYAFDRPDYLDAVCAGLRAQRQVRPDPQRVFLLQDGVVSALTGHRQTRPPLVRQSIEVFRRHFPQGEVLAAEHNLGIAENIMRGQRLVFETLDSDIGYFFEDDLEPGPYYLAALEAMRIATEPFADHVAHFAAYGKVPGAVPGPRVGWCQLDHHWGFGLRREPWRRIHAGLQDWWEEIRRNDYRARNRRRLLYLWRQRRAAGPVVAQDMAAATSCLELGLARLNTTVCFARYIGEKGEHFSPGMFSERGFVGMQWDEGPDFAFDPLEEAAIRGIADEAFRIGAEFRANRLEATIAETEAAMNDADRLVTADDVHMLWNLLLDRPRAPRAQVERHAGRTTLRALRRSIVRMHEFRHQTGP